MTTPRRDRWLLWSAGFALLLLFLQYTPTGQGITNRIVYLADGAGTAITSSTEGSFQPIHAALVDPNTNALLTYTSDPTHDSTAGTQGPQGMGFASAAAPTDVGADGRAVHLWALRNGALAVTPTFAGILPSTGVGAAGTGTQRVVDVASGTTLAAPPAQANYIAGVGSGATGGFLTPVTVCDSGSFLDMTTATTTEIVPLVASRTIHVCSLVAASNGTTTITLKRGTGTNCGTGTTSVYPAIELTAQTGWSEGTGIGDILGPSVATGVGGVMTSGNALCVTSSAAVNLHVKIRFAVF